MTIGFKKKTEFFEYITMSSYIKEFYIPGIDRAVRIMAGNGPPPRSYGDLKRNFSKMRITGSPDHPRGFSLYMRTRDYVKSSKRKSRQKKTSHHKRKVTFAHDEKMEDPYSRVYVKRNRHKNNSEELSSAEKNDPKRYDCEYSIEFDQLEEKLDQLESEYRRLCDEEAKEIIHESILLYRMKLMRCRNKLRLLARV
jgi:hypothetical protein